MKKSHVKTVKGIRVMIVPYEEGSDDAKHIEQMGIPLKCACCGEDYEYDDDEEEEELGPIELIEIIVIVDQKVIKANGRLSAKYIPKPYIMLFCRACYEAALKKDEQPDLPFYQ